MVYSPNLPHSRAGDVFSFNSTAATQCKDERNFCYLLLRGRCASGPGVCVPGHPVKATRENARRKPTKTRAELSNGNKVLRASFKLLYQNKVSLLPGFLITQANKFLFLKASLNCCYLTVSFLCEALPHPFPSPELSLLWDLSLYYEHAAWAAWPSLCYC